MAEMEPTTGVKMVLAPESGVKLKGLLFRAESKMWPKPLVMCLRM